MTSILAALLLGSPAHAIPAQFTHQGRLLDAEGAPLDGEATITFRVTDAESGGDTLWEEAITVTLTNGFYAAVLGSDEAGNPLDTEVWGVAPVWLELQLDGEDAMAPRSAINAVPYATLATVAEEVAGGPVDASEIAVGGTPVVNEAGEWVGPTPTVSWSDIEGMPEDFADGVDDDTDTDTDSFAELGTSCLDGDIPVWDSISAVWACDLDQDSLADIACTEGQLIAWGDDATGWVCADDVDTFLTEEDVDAMVADNGYAMASEIFSGSFLDLVDLAPGLADGDDDTQLTPEEVDAIVADNGYAMATDVFSGSYDDLTGVPPDADTLAATACEDGQILVYELATGTWACGDDTDTTLSSPEVRAIVEAVAGLALQAGASVDGSAVLTQSSHGDDAHTHHSATSDGLHITPASVALSGSDTQLVDGEIDLGSAADDALTSTMVQTLTGGGDADTLHTHAASSSGGSGRSGYLGVTSTPRAGDATLEVMENDCAAAYGAARMCRMSQIKNSYPAPRPDTQSWVVLDTTNNPSAGNDGYNMRVAEFGSGYDGISSRDYVILGHEAGFAYNCAKSGTPGLFVTTESPSTSLGYAAYQLHGVSILPSGRLDRVSCDNSFTVACCGPL